MSYYCEECLCELPSVWVDEHFDVDKDPLICKKCHKYDEQLNQGGDEE